MKTSNVNTELAQTTWLDLMVSISNGQEKEFLNNNDNDAEPLATFHV